MKELLRLWNSHTKDFTLLRVFTFNNFFPHLLSLVYVFFEIIFIVLPNFTSAIIYIKIYIYKNKTSVCFNFTNYFSTTNSFWCKETFKFQETNSDSFFNSNDTDTFLFSCEIPPFLFNLFYVASRRVAVPSDAFINTSFLFFRVLRTS